MATDLIRYDLLVQDALRGVVRKVLADVVQGGLLGEHHFNITFKTHAPGVQLSSRMRNEYPGEMTIILQHQFWGLKVNEHDFEVGLSFHKVPETLIIPFDALTVFSDPSVPFGMKFETEMGANDIDGPLDDEDTIGARRPGDNAVPAFAPEKTSPALGGPMGLLPARTGGDAADSPETEPGKVISIDAFRKKT